MSSRDWSRRRSHFVVSIAGVLAFAISGCRSSTSSSNQTLPATSSATAPSTAISDSSTSAPSSTSPASSTSSSDVSSTAPTTVATTLGGTQVFGASTNPVLVPTSGCCTAAPRVLLKAVTAQHLVGLDRIVFQMSEAPTNYHVRYVPLPVKQDPSDLAVVLPGDSALQISFGGTGLDQSTNPATQTYTGPQAINVEGGVVLKLVQIGDFEAVSNWAVGVRGRPAFKVSMASNPARLIIEVVSG